LHVFIYFFERFQKHLGLGLGFWLR